MFLFTNYSIVNSIKKRIDDIYAIFKNQFNYFDYEVYIPFGLGRTITEWTNSDGDFKEFAVNINLENKIFSPHLRLYIDACYEFWNTNAGGSKINVGTELTTSSNRTIKDTPSFLNWLDLYPDNFFGFSTSDNNRHHIIHYIQEYFIGKPQLIGNNIRYYPEYIKNIKLITWLRYFYKESELPASGDIYKPPADYYVPAPVIPTVPRTAHAKLLYVLLVFKD